MKGALMIQGTASNVGKSALVLGLCRALTLRGYRVAPFKSQNMALNSSVTSDGGEIGRAQAAQAYACNLLPSTDMNPVLLKPLSAGKSQVIVDGISHGTYSAREYQEMKQGLLPHVTAAFDRLARDHDFIIVEGAGSPAEINLREYDIVNMGLAEALDLPVVLVGDIDKGGVFASLLGTLELLSPEERKRVHGLIINKFRGDKTLLTSGIEMLEARVEKPVLAVVDYIQVDLEQEDSLTHKEHLDLKQRQTERCSDQPVVDLGAVQTENNVIRVAFIDLPFAANITDLHELERRSSFIVTSHKSPVELEKYSSSTGIQIKPDIIVIPGSKGTISALDSLKNTGWKPYLEKYVHEGGVVVGLCGGYQMLGEFLIDTTGADGVKGQVEGLSLLPVVTHFSVDKTVRHTHFEASRDIRESHLERVQLFKEISGEGYEIHHGITTWSQKSSVAQSGYLPERVSSSQRVNSSSNAFSLVERRQSYQCADGGQPDDQPDELLGVGVINGTGCVLGTYLHGFFENTSVLVALAELVGKPHLREEILSDVGSREYYRSQYNRMAELCEKTIDIDALIEMMELTYQQSTRSGE